MSGTFAMQSRPYGWPLECCPIGPSHSVKPLAVRPRLTDAAADGEAKSQSRVKR